MPRPVLFLLLLFGLRLPLAAQLPPDAAWRTFQTEHFRIVYPEGLEPSARRAADRAEDAYALLARELVRPPRGRIELVVTDNVDFANGYATPIPRNRVVVYTHPPVDEPMLSFMDDWLEQVILHELVHIFHLDYAAGPWRPLRSVLGRNLALFPQVLAPAWVAEGLATYFESRLTGEGRVRGTMHDMILRTAALEDAFFSIDRLTAEPVTWPAGQSRYVYSSLFIDHLARRYGPERVPAFVEAYGRAVAPFRLNAAARRAFGTTLTREWTVWADSLRRHYGAVADSLGALGVTLPEVVAGGGRYAQHPRWAPDGERLAFVEANGRDEPATRVLHPGGRVETLAPRTSLGPLSWLPDGRALLDAQLDFVDPYRIYSDLHRVEAGEEDDVTEGARVWEPDLHPDGRRAVVVAHAPGTNLLAVYDLAAGTLRSLTAPSLDLYWSAPRWSPTGERIAVGRWRAGGRYDVVLLDTLGAVVREITADRAVDSSPAWSPDGRYVLFASDRTGIPNLFAYDVRDGRLRQVTNVLTGAFHPDVSPDGRWIAFSYYRADGYHIARIPFDPAAWRDAPPPVDRFGPETDPSRFDETAGGAAREYSALPFLAPTAWTPLLDAGPRALGVGIGAAVAGADVVDRHAWSAQLLAYPTGSRLEALLGYRYRGWGTPVLGLVAQQDWSVAAPAGGGAKSDLLERRREVAAALTWPRPGWRSNAWLSVGGELLQRDFLWDDAATGDAPPAGFPLDAGAVLSAGWSSLRSFGISLGVQQGVLGMATVEGHRFLEPLAAAEGSRGDLRLTGTGRGYQAVGGLPGFARHVLALRAEAGAESGASSPGFRVGGVEGGLGRGPLAVGIPNGRLALPVRGFPDATRIGNRAFSATAEYRFPLLLVERGVGLLPLSLNRLWGDLFLDAGAAWCPGRCGPRLPRGTADFDPLLSAGAELVVDLDLFFLADLPLRFGVAFPLRGAADRSPSGYVSLATGR